MTKDEAKHIHDFYTKNFPGLIKQYDTINDSEIPTSNYHFILNLDVLFHKTLPIMTKEDIKKLEFDTPQVEVRYQNNRTHPSNRIEFDIPQTEDEVDSNRQNGTHVQRLLSTRQGNDVDNNSYAERVLNSRNVQNGLPRH